MTATVPIRQYSQEWFEARRGRVTASRVCDIVKERADKKPSTSRANYMLELLTERLGGELPEPYQSKEMRWGTEHEDQAVAAYEWRHKVAVTEGGFILHPSLAAGASPDRLVGDDGIVEVKCPNSLQHMTALTTGCVPPEYGHQIYWQLACCPTRKWVDYISFDPRFPPPMRLFVRRVPRDGRAIGDLEAKVRKFLAELDAMEAQVRAEFLQEAA